MRRVWPFRHLGLKIWSVALAVALWLSVSGDEIVERGLRVPLELQQFPAGLELQGDAPALVDVRVRGQSSALARVGAGDIIAVIDLKGAKAGRRLFQLTPEQVRVPFGVEVVQVTPSIVPLAFDVTATRQLPVVPAVEGIPATGFVAGQPTADPATIEVLGPEGDVARASSATTEPVSVAGAKANVTETVNIGFEDPALRLRAPRQAVVTVPILPAPIERTLQDRPVQVRGLGANLAGSVSPVGVDVVLRGSRDALAAVNPDIVTVFVDVAGLAAGRYNLGVQVDAPSGAGVAQIIPATVHVSISRGKR
jgi:YbbR domain-containing protein